jgi:hypothetical protein
VISFMISLLCDVSVIIIADDCNVSNIIAL